MDTRESYESKFTVDDSLAAFSVAAREWVVKSKRENELDGLATAIVVFNSEGRVLLIQRASKDSMPNKWELPGGAVDEEDPTILHGAARELWEESGLTARRFTHIISEDPERGPGQIFLPGSQTDEEERSMLQASERELGHTFQNSTKTKTWCRFTFQVEVDDCGRVYLDPNEHQNFTWALEDEVREQKSGDRQLPITREVVRSLILSAFKAKRIRDQATTTT